MTYYERKNICWGPPSYRNTPGALSCHNITLERAVTARHATV